MQLIYFAHGVVEDGGDYASVAVAGWSSVALAEAEAADEGLAGLVEDELRRMPSGLFMPQTKQLFFCIFT